MVTIRKALEADFEDVLHVQEQAFGSEGAEIVELVKGLLVDPSAAPLFSLLAVDDMQQVVGHILFTKAHIGHDNDSPAAEILAPLAVVPRVQSRGVGGQLIKEGLQQLSRAGIALVFVLGHQAYYPRHGFKPAGALGFEATYPIPEKNADAWMVQELRPGVIGNVRGKVVCADALKRPEYWRE